MLVIVLLCGCQPHTENKARIWIGQTLPPAVSVAEVRLPQKLGGFTLQGEIADQRDKLRVALYGNEGQSLRVSVYALPGGWEEFDDERRVGSQYLQTRQDFVDRLLKRGAQSVRLINESVNEGTDGDLVMASATLEASPWIPEGRVQFILTSSAHYLLQLSRDSSEKSDAIPLLKNLTRDLVAYLDQPNT